MTVTDSWTNPSRRSDAMVGRRSRMGLATTPREQTPTCAQTRPRDRNRVDTNGCAPIQDMDGDGVNDEFDQCPMNRWAPTVSRTVVLLFHKVETANPSKCLVSP